MTWVAYFDVNGLHVVGTTETDVAGYQAVTTIGGQRCVLLLPTQGDGDEAVISHQHARRRPPAGARRGGERALR